MLPKDRYDDIDKCLDDYRVWYETNQRRVVNPTDCLRFLRLAADGFLFLFHGLRARLIELPGKRKNVELLDKELNDYTNWYAVNCDTVTDVVPTLHFLKRALDKSLMLMHLLRDELREAEDKYAAGSHLWLPETLRH